MQGNNEKLLNLPLDISMAWHLGAEQYKLYHEAESDDEPEKRKYHLTKDLEEVLGFFKRSKNSEKQTNL